MTHLIQHTAWSSTHRTMVRVSGCIDPALKPCDTYLRTDERMTQRCINTHQIRIRWSREKTTSTPRAAGAHLATINRIGEHSYACSSTLIASHHQVQHSFSCDVAIGKRKGFRGKWQPIWSNDLRVCFSENLLNSHWLTSHHPNRISQHITITLLIPT